MYKLLYRLHKIALLKSSYNFSPLVIKSMRLTIAKIKSMRLTIAKIKQSTSTGDMGFTAYTPKPKQLTPLQQLKLDQALVHSLIGLPYLNDISKLDLTKPIHIGFSGGTQGRGSKYLTYFRKRYPNSLLFRYADVNQAHKLLPQLKDAQLHLHGYSWGSGAAQQFALMNPKRQFASMTVVDPTSRSHYPRVNKNVSSLTHYRATKPVGGNIDLRLRMAGRVGKPIQGATNIDLPYSHTDILEYWK